MHPGLVGGIIGTRASIKNTSGPRERTFIIKASVIGWTAGGVFIALLLLLPSPWRFLIWVPYSIILPLGIIKGNRAIQKIRQEEALDTTTAEKSP
jgi:hypothetical protein